MPHRNNPTLLETDMMEAGDPRLYPVPRVYSNATLLDLFAGLALVGLLSHPESNKNVDKVAQDAYLCATAMLEERMDRNDS